MTRRHDSMRAIYESTKCGIFYEGSRRFFHDPAPRRMHAIYESTSVGLLSGISS